MKPVLFLQNITLEGPGTIGSFFDERNISYTVRDLYAGSQVPAQPGGYCAVIVLGGPMNADDDDKYSYLTDEKRFLCACVDQSVPVLGICLGAQLLARALGARVFKNKTSEIGWMDVRLTEAGQASPLMKGLGSPLSVFQWHGDTSEVPEGGQHLAESAACINQAFRFGPTAYGLQFHLEVTCSEAAKWAEAYLPDINAADEPQARRLINQPQYDKEKEVAQSAEALLKNFYALCQQ
ncbi:MAG: type 1 glutamine amidotransferase [Candidatus Hinthialibacter antarcticus]|nr:type 1 glutamine amidotransferase [Candidatus Hinthialibacter antarcticus]